MEIDARWCKSIVVGTGDAVLELAGGPKETRVLTLTMNSMYPGRSAMDAAFAAEPDEQLVFAVPLSALPLLLKNLQAQLEG